MSRPSALYLEANQIFTRPYEEIYLLIPFQPVEDVDLLSSGTVEQTCPYG